MIRNQAHINNRAAGSLVGMACGDALGAPFEFGPPLSKSIKLEMSGGGAFSWGPGEWTDDTSMAIPIAKAVAAGKDLLHEETLLELLEDWVDWARDARDVGMQTKRALDRIAAAPLSEAYARQVARELHDETGQSAGNGSLMRTAPVALAYVHDSSGLTEAATRIAKLTHWEETGAEACIIWCHAIVHAIRTGELTLEPGLNELDGDRSQFWRDVIAEAETQSPEDFTSKNGWVVAALQGAWSAITRSQDSGEGAVGAIERAVRGGGDSDTVAAIAGALAGAASGVSGLPARWRRKLNGWPGMSARDLVTLAVLSQGGQQSNGWPTSERVSYPPTKSDIVQHPHDSGVWLGSVGALDQLPDFIDSVISLCQIGTNQSPVETTEFWLIDNDGQNLNLEFVFTDIAETIDQLRSEGKSVLLHCVASQSRTPNAAIAYSVLKRSIPLDKAIADIGSIMTIHSNTNDLPRAVQALASRLEN